VLEHHRGPGLGGAVLQCRRWDLFLGSDGKDSIRRRAQAEAGASRRVKLEELNGYWRGRFEA
jgi:hypothetical protein